MNFNYKKLFITAIILAVVSSLFNWLTCGWLFNWVYLLEPLSVWKVVDVQSTTFLITSLVSSFILMAILTGVYEEIRKGISCNGITKGLCFGTMVWLVGILPGMWGTYVFQSMNTTVVIYWLIQGLVKYLIFGAIIAYMYELRK
jgi:hypothetical protein